MCAGLQRRLKILTSRSGSTWIAGRSSSMSNSQEAGKSRASLENREKWRLVRSARRKHIRKDTVGLRQEVPPASQLLCDSSSQLESNVWTQFAYECLDLFLQPFRCYLLALLYQ